MIFVPNRLSKELLLDPQQTLVFKVWHKAGRVCSVVLRGAFSASRSLGDFCLIQIK